MRQNKGEREMRTGGWQNILSTLPGTALNWFSGNAEGFRREPWKKFGIRRSCWQDRSHGRMSAQLQQAISEQN